MLATAKAFAKLIRNQVYDGLRFLRFSSTLAPMNARARLAAQIKMDAHRIEKGMALPNSRAGFGLDVIDRLIRDIAIYEDLFGADRTSGIARRALTEYHRVGTAHGKTHSRLETFLAQGAKPVDTSATIVLDAASVRSRSKIDFAAFAQSRHSLRQFAPDPVNPRLIEMAIEAAERTPSVCNRQAARAWHIADPSLRARLLAVQGGNRGFGETISELIIVTSELGNFVTPAERYQCWVDGGLFAMSLVYALHAQGLGTCMLNWSVDPSRDIAARRLMGLPQTENIIVFIAVGHYPDEFTVAASPRQDIGKLLVRI